MENFIYMCRKLLRHRPNKEIFDVDRAHKL